MTEQILSVNFDVAIDIVKEGAMCVKVYGREQILWDLPICGSGYSDIMICLRN